MNIITDSPRLRQIGLLLFFGGWLCCHHYRPEPWLKQMAYGILTWQIASSGVWLTGMAILLAKSRAAQRWAPALRLGLLLLMTAVLGMGVYYTYQIQQADAELAKWHQRRVESAPHR